MSSNSRVPTWIIHYTCLVSSFSTTFLVGMFKNGETLHLFLWNKWLFPWGRTPLWNFHCNENSLKTVTLKWTSDTNFCIFSPKINRFSRGIYEISDIEWLVQNIMDELFNNNFLPTSIRASV